MMRKGVIKVLILHSNGKCLLVHSEKYVRALPASIMDDVVAEVGAAIADVADGHDASRLPYYDAVAVQEVEQGKPSKGVVLKAPDGEQLFTLSLRSIAERILLYARDGVRLSSSDFETLSPAAGQRLRCGVTGYLGPPAARADTSLARAHMTHLPLTADTFDLQTIPHAELINSTRSRNGKGTEVLEVGLAVTVASPKVPAARHKGKELDSRG